MELSDILHGIFLLGGINQVIIPMALWNYQSHPSHLKVEFDHIYSYRQLPNNYNALDYTNIANSLVHNYAEGEGVCEDYACATLEVYRSLIFLNKRKELKKKIRLAAGLANFFWDTEGHMILEVDNGNGFFPYETMFKIPVLDPKKVKEYNARKKIRPLTVTLGRSFAGMDLFYPTFSAFFYPGGILRAWYIGFSKFGIRDEKIEE